MATRRAGAPSAVCPAADLPEHGLDATVDPGASATVIRLRGSLRSATAATLRLAVESALGAGAEAVVLDLTAVVADDELGLWAVPTVAGDAARCGIPLTVVAPDRRLRTRLRRLGARHVEITDAAPVE